MNWELLNFILGFLTVIFLGLYVIFTYRISKESIRPIVSIILKQGERSHLNFYMKNHSLVETKSFVKIWTNIKKERFEFNEGPYGYKAPWINPPLTVLNGHFELQELVNKQNENLEKYVKSRKIKSIEFIVYITYKRFGGRRWVVPSPQRWIYNFDTQEFWLDIGFNPKP